MITMQQLEELESRIIKALQLIGDLRTENAKLESDNETLKAETEDARLSLEEKEHEVARIQKELDEATRELAGLKEKEEVLGKKIIELLGKLDGIRGGSTESPRAAAAESSPADISVETLREAGESKAAERDDDIIIIDDDTALGDVEVVVETVPSKESSGDEIILLDEGEDEIVIDDIDSELAIIDESEADQSKKKKEAKDSSDIDDDFLIIEDE